MRLFHTLALLCMIPLAGRAVEDGVAPVSETEQSFSDALGKEFQTLQKSGTQVLAQPEGWLFFAPELRLLSVGKFWGNAAIGIARSRKPEEADPAPAIIDFDRQLKERGIRLLLVPVPPKAAIYPEKVLPGINLQGQNAAPYLTRFYEELRGQGVEVLDLAPIFRKERESERGPVFCRTDTHWSGRGCVVAAQAMAARVRETAAGPARHEYDSTWQQVQIAGDLVSLLPREAARPAPETTFVRLISEKPGGTPVQPDAESPILLLGDSHTLVFHDFLAERAGLLDQLANELGFAPDLIGTRGSGATAVRVSLYRRSHKDPNYLAKKKMVIWCFSARELTEADGWARIPVSK